MPKRKDSIALFEVITKGKDSHGESVSVPNWAQGQAQATPAPVGEGEPVEPAHEPAAAPVGYEAPARTPIYVRGEGRFILTLDYRQAIIAGAAAVLVLTVMFWLGRLSVGQPAPGPGPQEQGQPAGEGAAGSGEMRGVPRERVNGKHYLVIQSLFGNSAEDRVAAEKIVAFLQAKGRPADIQQWRVVNRGRNVEQYVVWSLEGFDSINSSQAKAFVTEIERLGQEYIRQYPGTYSFKQGRDTWFVKYPIGR